jgi:hypothetical protein
MDMVKLMVMELSTESCWSRHVAVDRKSMMMWEEESTEVPEAGQKIAGK